MISEVQSGAIDGNHHHLSGGTEVTLSDRSHERSVNPTLTLAVVVASVFAYKGLESILSPALPLIQESLGATEAQIAWVITGVLLTGAVATPLIGRLSDIRDKKTILLAVLAIVAAGTAVSGLSNSILMLTCGQLLQGVGLAVVPLAFGIIRDTQTEARIKSGNGSVIAFIYAGTAFALVGSGLLVSVLPWRWLFSVPFAIITIIFIAAWRLIPSCPPANHGRVDYTGATFLGSGMAVILIGITKAPEWGWLSIEFGATVLICVALLTTFVALELRSSEPLIDVRLLATRPLAVSCLVYLLCGFATNALFLAVPMLVQQPTDTGFGLGASEFTTSLLLLPLGLAGAVVAPLTGWLDLRVGGRTTMLAGVILAGASFILLLTANGHFLMVMGATILIGASGGITLTQAMNTVALTSPVSRIGAFSGLAFVVKAVGGTLGVQLSGSILTTGTSTAAPTWASFTIVFVMGISVTALVALSCLLLPRRATTTSMQESEPLVDTRASTD
ncbi:MFS transporter [Rhodococcus opacus]|uniref:MFS transporter n=1 Tax=Rhodococcus opacus TaxID=37919 RepID=A0AAX3YSV2_RHOOP|nr:MFS transporter [Rhodococcus opacus]MCZ4590607.1 MFS transporter [Rhodococcus opacus]WLF52145.1 MFS transporter [Rhodococcus opacus]